MTVVHYMQLVEWRNPLWLLLALQPVLLWLVRYISQTRRLTAYADPELLPWLMVQKHTHWPKWLLSRTAAYSFAWLLFAVAAAGPRLPIDTPRGLSANAMNIMTVIDLSRSMGSEDVRPTRLRRASLELDNLMSRVRGQRLGVIVFAARPHVFVPLTWDHQALHYYLQSLDKLVLPTRGSQLTPALSLARQQLAEDKRPAAIVLFSDGDYQFADASQRNNLLQFCRQLKESHIPLYILGLGSSEGGPIPIETGGWLTDAGKPVISRMNEPLLRQLADASGGRYSRVSDDNSDWQTLYNDGMMQQFPALRQHSQRQWQELFPWALLPGALLLITAIFPLRLPRSSGVASASVVCAVSVIALMLFTGRDASAATAATQQVALQAFQHGDYDNALKLYQQLSGYRGHFGAGAAFYRKANYPAAQHEFMAAIIAADTEGQRANALFNLGNSYFKQGDYRSALRSFADVLRYQSDYPAAQHNLELSRALYKRVTSELQQTDSGSLPGRGVRPAGTADNIDLSNNIAASMDDSDKRKSTIIPPLPDTPATQKLIDKGLAFARLAATTKSPEPTIQQQQALAEARLFMLQIEQRPATLWQRLFEKEEGFAAPQTQPNTIPGVTPW